MTFTHITTPAGFPQEFLDTMHEAAIKAASPANTVPDASVNGRPSPSYAPPDMSISKDVTAASNHYFLRRPALVRPTQEWEASLNQLLSFCAEQQLADARNLLLHLKLDAAALAERRICVVALLKPNCKGELERLAQHVCNEVIPLTRRRGVLSKLGEVDLCVDRIRQELRKASMELGAYLGGLSGEASQAFIAMCHVHLKEALRQEPMLKDYDAESVHVLQPFLKALRLPGFHAPDERSDKFVVDVSCHGDVLARCGAEVARRTDGMSIAVWLADSCLNEVAEMLEEELRGVTPDFMNGEGHFAKLEDVVLRIARRFGPLDPLSFCTLDDELCPQGLARSSEMLAIDMRRKLTQECKFAPPAERVLHQYQDFGALHTVGLIDGRPYVRVDDPGGGRSICRPLTQLNAAHLLDASASSTPQHPGKAPVLDDEAREVLRDHVVKQGRASDRKTESGARRMALNHPSPARVGHIMAEVITDDDTLAGWMHGHPGKWNADTLDRAFHEILGNGRPAAMRLLLSQWQAPGFPDAWLRQVRRWATRIRAENRDNRIRELHRSGTQYAKVRRSAQGELLSRIEALLGQDLVPLGACRQEARVLASTYPVGHPSRDGIAQASLDRLGAAVDGLRDGPGRKVLAPILVEDGGLAAALESSLFTSDLKFKAELALVRRLGETLKLSSEDIGALLQVTSDDRFPVPFPVVGAAVLMGRFPSYITAVFAWTRQLYRDGLLDAATVKRILVPDTLTAEHAGQEAAAPHVANALQRYLDELSATVAEGILSFEDLTAATGLSGAAPCPLIRSALQRGKALAAKRWENWRDGTQARAGSSSRPSTRSSVSSA
jgi:hypothetical protein